MINEEIFYINMGKKIRMLREEQKMTQNQFSDFCQLKLDPTTISGIESGRQAISALQLFKIMTCFNVSFDDLISIEEDKIKGSGVDLLTDDEYKKVEEK